MLLLSRPVLYQLGGTALSRCPLLAVAFGSFYAYGSVDQLFKCCGHSCAKHRHHMQPPCNQTYLYQARPSPTNILCARNRVMPGPVVALPCGKDPLHGNVMQAGIDCTCPAGWQGQALCLKSRSPSTDPDDCACRSRSWHVPSTAGAFGSSSIHRRRLPSH